jgi:hypothetical protein
LIPSTLDGVLVCCAGWFGSEAQPVFSKLVVFGILNAIASTARCRARRSRGILRHPAGQVLGSEKTLFRDIAVCCTFDNGCSEMELVKQRRCNSLIMKMQLPFSIEDFDYTIIQSKLYEIYRKDALKDSFRK